MSNPINNVDKNNTDHEISKSDSTKVILYCFPKQGIGQWRVQDDAVMGGQSDSQLKITSENHAHFSGHVSLENNGGFCSIHQKLESNPYVIYKNSEAFILLLKGDGNAYNFRVRTPYGRHSYCFTFHTKGDSKWERVSIPFNLMEAKYRGRSIEAPNYAGENIVEMRFLIGNKKEETFEILINSIEVI